MAGMQGAALNAAVMTGVSGGMEVMDFLVELCRRELERFGGID